MQWDPGCDSDFCKVLQVQFLWPHVPIEILLKQIWKKQIALFFIIMEKQACLKNSQTSLWDFQKKSVCYYHMQQQSGIPLPMVDACHASSALTSNY